MRQHAYIEELCKEYAAKSDGRIVYKHLDHNGGISYNTNECYKLATGDYIGLFDQDDILHPSVLYAYVKEINEQGADYLYCDETTFQEDNINKMLTMHFKPDYAPDNLRANNYICHFSVFSRKLLEGEELFRTAFDGAAGPRYDPASDGQSTKDRTCAQTDVLLEKPCGQYRRQY